MQNSKKGVTAIADKKVTFIQEGITGKQLTNLKIESNKLNKDELRSISFQLSQFNKHGQALLKALKVSFTECTPANLLPYLTASETERTSKDGGRFTYWLIESLAIRFAKDGGVLAKKAKLAAAAKRTTKPRASRAKAAKLAA